MTATGAAAGVRAGWPVVVALGFGVFIGGFDQTFVVPVLTNMLGDLNVAIDQLEQASWILNGYLLGYTVALPLMGRLADVHGHYRIFVVGMLIFMGGSVIVALAPNLAILTIARAVTALGGGALVPVGLAIASHSLPKSQRTMGIAAISTLDDASSLAGPLWGTLIGVWIGWRGLFWMNIVLALPVLILVLFLARRVSAPPRANEKVDWQGGLLLSVALAALTFAIAGAGESLSELWMVLSLYAAAAVFLGVVHGAAVAGGVAADRHAHVPHPAGGGGERRVPPGRDGAHDSARERAPAGGLCLGPGRRGSRSDAWENGAVHGRRGIVGGALATIWGYRLTTLLSFGIGAAGLFAMASWGTEPTQITLWVSLGLAGFGFTLADASLYSTVMEGVRNRKTCLRHGGAPSLADPWHGGRHGAPWIARARTLRRADGGDFRGGVRQRNGGEHPGGSSRDADGDVLRGSAVDGGSRGSFAGVGKRPDLATGRQRRRAQTLRRGTGGP